MNQESVFRNFLHLVVSGSISVELGQRNPAFATEKAARSGPPCQIASTIINAYLPTRDARISLEGKSEHCLGPKILYV